MADFILQAKGESKYLSVQELVVTLRWRAAVDLDLVAFYVTKEGQTGGVFSDNYMGGDLGDLHRAPFMRLSGDELEGGGDVDSEEELVIKRLDHIQELYLLAINYTDATQNNATPFSSYDGHVEVKTHRGERFTVPLNDTSSGCVALVCKIVNQPITGPQLINDVRVMNLSEFHQEIPGATALQVGTKLILREKGSSAPLARKKSHAPIHAQLKWTAPVDLDLHCFYLPKKRETRGLFSFLFGGGSPQLKHIYFGQLGDLHSPPYILLDQDAGIGDVGGDNEENIEITRTDHLDALLFVANIFNKPNAQFSSYDGSVTVRCGATEIEVPLSSRTVGSWALIAQIDCRSNELKVINMDRVKKDKPTSKDFNS